MSKRLKLTSGPGDRSSPMYLLAAKGTVATARTSTVHPGLVERMRNGTDLDSVLVEILMGAYGPPLQAHCGPSRRHEVAQAARGTHPSEAVGNHSPGWGPELGPAAGSPAPADPFSPAISGRMLSCPNP